MKIVAQVGERHVLAITVDNVIRPILIRKGADQPLIMILGGVIGGLVAFGILTVYGSRKARLEPAGEEPGGAGPVLAGFVTSIANPYFWIWWLTVGSALLVGAMEGGVVVMAAFIAGHWCADLGWYTVVSAGIAKGRTILSDRTYRWIMAACVGFLVIFGVYYLVRVIFP